MAPALRAGLIAAAAAAALAAAYVVFWFAVAGGLRQGIEEWTVARRAEGWTAGYRRLTLGGFPFHLRATVEGGRLAPPGAPPPWAWQGQRAVAVMRPWGTGTVTVVLTGTHRVSLGVAGKAVTYGGDVGTLRAEIGTVDGRPRSARLTVGALDLAGDEGSLALARAEATARLMGVADADYRTPTLELAIDVEGLHLPAGLGLPLGRRVARLALKARLMGTIAAAPGRDSLAAWRDAGGTVEVVRFRLAYGPLTLTAAGTLALDAEMQPVGAFTAKIGGFFGTIDALRAKGIVRAGQAVTAKIVLGVLARRPEGGGPPVLTVPLRLQNRTLHAGPLALIEVPAIAWPAAGQTN